jgi:hypothetical protein
MATNNNNNALDNFMTSARVALYKNTLLLIRKLVNERNSKRMPVPNDQRRISEGSTPPCQVVQMESVSESSIQQRKRIGCRILDVFRPVERNAPPWNRLGSTGKISYYAQITAYLGNRAYINGNRIRKAGTRHVKTMNFHVNPYEYWFRRSTRRRAKRRAKKCYKNIVKDHITMGYIDEEENLDNMYPPPKPKVVVTDTPVLTKTGKYKTTEEDSPKLDRVGDQSTEVVEEVKVKDEQTSINNGKSPIKEFARGMRSQELVAAAELRFGKMKLDEANYEVVRRMMSEHDLVKGSSVRISHQVGLVNRALERYFVLHEDDLVSRWSIFNMKNTKRHKQRGVMHC